ncbi:hypothetical protein C9374_007092 [Naegleria lovaniensis]|uniref:Guanylate cyclase domain-containing protein n=1 Tax=Naegleria lovaniensis TaxID=51637 RepID=A0AA88KRS7_NAELO|nr:uncharacterized protein C9374_007092 [Naegleria lovaniensis]KAG2393561.1 hypothetical protein C9374_007092 [Naegleria lovaniensis]
MSPRFADMISSRQRRNEKSYRSEAGCLVSQVRCDSSQTVNLIKFDWLSSEISAELAKIVLEEELGICAEIVTLGNVTYALDEMARNGDQTHYVMLEFWRQTRKSLYYEYVEQQKTVVDAGSLGLYGKAGWFVFSFMTREYPGIDVYREYRTDRAVRYLAANSSATMGRFLGPAKTWLSLDAQIINNLKLKLQIEYANDKNTEDHIVTRIERAFLERKPSLFYFWTPHFLFSAINLDPVYLPGYSESCWTEYNQQHGLIDCDYPADLLTKLTSRSVHKDGRLNQFFRLFSFQSQQDIIDIMEDVAYSNMSSFAASCKWIKNNTALVKSWLPENMSKESVALIGTVVGSVTILIFVFGLIFVIGLIFCCMYRRKLRKHALRYAPKTLPVTVVFTDIQNSTLLWSTCPDKMKHVLEIHNLIMRVNIEKYQGYECKTQGDSFMVAFESPLMALGFCLSVQRDLLLANWPLEMLDYEDMREVKWEEKLIYRGPRVRMGVHTGSDCEIHKDKTTKRFDYIGNSINKASKVESISVGGRVYCSEEFIEALKQTVLTQLMTVKQDSDTILKKLAENDIQFFNVDEVDDQEVYWVMEFSFDRTLFIQQFELKLGVDKEVAAKIQLGEDMKRFICDSDSFSQEQKSKLVFDFITVVNHDNIRDRIAPWSLVPVTNLFSVAYNYLTRGWTPLPSSSNVEIINIIEHKNL